VVTRARSSRRSRWCSSKRSELYNARVDHEDILRQYLAGDRVDISKAMRSLPPTVDVALVVGVVEKLIDRKFWIGRLCKKLPPRAIRAVLAAPMAHANHLFLRMAVSPDASDSVLAQRWQHALETLLDLESYEWGSKQKRAKIAKVVADAHALAAIQATVAHSKSREIGADMLAVLVADGSTASYDALVTHIDAAFSAGDSRLDLLARLRSYAARTPALDVLFAELDGALQTRNDISPALALGPIIGIGEVSLLWFDVWLASARITTNHVPWIQGSIRIDSRSATWFYVHAGTVEPDGGHKGTYFHTDTLARDELGLGRCEAADLPRWLASAAAKLAITWAPFQPRSNLRGKKRERIARWLAGA
jgi:hypothetical protein